MESKEDILNKINEHEIEYFDDVSEEFQNNEEIIYDLIDENDGEPLSSFPEKSVLKIRN